MIKKLLSAFSRKPKPTPQAALKGGGRLVVGKEKEKFVREHFARGPSMRDWKIIQNGSQILMVHRKTRRKKRMHINQFAQHYPRPFWRKFKRHYNLRTF